MGPGGGIDWGNVIVALIGAVGSWGAVAVSVLIARVLRTPSGDPIGHVAERGEHLSAADVHMSRYILAHASGDHDLALRLLREALDKNGIQLDAEEGDG